MTWALHNSDCLTGMAALPDASIDACVTDPPYDLTANKKGGSGLASVNLDSPYGRARIGTSNGGGFMGKAWDSTGIAFDPATWREVLRVLKPGAHLVAFGGSRTYHRMACAIEDAGFEVRDSIHWHYGSGFPKSLNLGDGLGTALKPAHEPIVLARKPLIGTVAANVEAHRTGALNIDACRVAGAPSGSRDYVRTTTPPMGGADGIRRIAVEGAHVEYSDHPSGRWPPNVLLTHSPECVRVGDRKVAAKPQGAKPADSRERAMAFGMTPGTSDYADPDGTETVPAFACHASCPVAALDRQSGPTGAVAPASGPTLTDGSGAGVAYGARNGLDRAPAFHNDSGGASRFFPTFEWDADDWFPFMYEAKAARSEREQGTAGLPARAGAAAVEREADSAGTKSPRAGAGRTASEVRNFHPTVKPITLMRWLVRLVTPPGGTVLEPFMGSGTTGCACAAEDRGFVGFEREPDYFAIAQARVADARARPLQRGLFAPEAA